MGCSAWEIERIDRRRENIEENEKTAEEEGEGHFEGSRVLTRTLIICWLRHVTYTGNSGEFLLLQIHVTN